MRRRCRAQKIDALLRKWLRKLPHPFTAADRQAGYRYDVSILQAEFSLTQVLDRPLTGRVFFEEVIRENLDLGRPDQVQLIFERRVTERRRDAFAPASSPRASFRRCTSTTRIPGSSSTTRKAGPCAPRPPSTTPATSASANGCATCPPCGRSASRPTDVFWTSKRLSTIARSAKTRSIRSCAPSKSMGNAPARCTSATRALRRLFAAIVLFGLQTRGFDNQQLRSHLASLLGLDSTNYPPGRMTYDLRRLRLHGLIERIPNSHRYQLTPQGLRIALFFSRTYARLLRPGLAEITDSSTISPSTLRNAFDRLQTAIDQRCEDLKLAA